MTKPNAPPPPHAPLPDPSATAPDPRFAGRSVHLIGIGGCGMSGLARMLRRRGARVTGSDSTSSDTTMALRSEGIPVNHDQRLGLLPDHCERVIASAAIKPDHPEMLEAQARGIEPMSYAEALGLAQVGRTGVSIAGTHGKSTTSSMLSHILVSCGLDPSFIVGAVCPQIGGGSRTGGDSIPTGSLAGRPGILVCEACEFNRSFHHHHPHLALVNNIEEDHLDVYSGLDEIVEAFHGFARLVPAAAEGGRLLIAHEGAHRRTVTAGLTCAVSTFGFNPDADYQVRYEPRSGATTLVRDGAELASWNVRLPGEHNGLNSAAAAILAHWLGASWDGIAAALSSFQGLDRRMQRLGSRALPASVGGGSVTVYDDYGHHPTECEKTLKAIRAAEQPKRMICVFQPHQHSRTRFLLEQFAASFSTADVVIVPHIYFVRDSETERTRVSAADLVDRLRHRGVCAMHLYPFEAIVEQLEAICRDGDLVVIMGAGPVWQVARAFLDRGRQERGDDDAASPRLGVA
ncbi:MAG: UDP-N-acetylmuramate--L-alanine ligase [Phycisphaerales bacterium]|nr:UDP-N-acetylmuramate--L-alanine ligase [Phycisphaerales bacterium]